MSAGTAPSESLAAIAAAWAGVRLMLGVLINSFGPPPELLEMRLLPRRWRRDLLAWLRPAEAVVRRLLLIRAAEIAAEVAAAPVRPAPAAKRPRPPRFTPRAESAAWRGVCFRLVPSGPRPRSGQRAASRLERLEKRQVSPTWQEIWGGATPPRAPAPCTIVVVPRPRPAPPALAAAARPEPFAAAPLAERLEALIRVVHQPEPRAKRLARRLLAEPMAAQRLLRPMPDDPGNPARAALTELEAPAAAAAHALLKRYFSSA